MKSILVIGGAGYIGSHLVKRLSSNKYNVIILDDFSTGHVESIVNYKYYRGDLGDQQLLRLIFAENKIDVVMHFAAHIEVEESVSNPLKYYNNNFVKVLSLLNSMIEHNILNFVFSSTAAVFGIPSAKKISEKHPKHPINPYGMSKFFIENILKDFDRAYNLKYTILRYFNASGADDSMLIGESHHPETHLIPLIFKAALGHIDNVKLYGSDYKTFDGTCIRDFVHTNDIADAHILAMEKMLTDNKSDDYNIGCGNGYSVLDVIQKVKEITKCNFDVVLENRREGDPPFLVADSEKALRELKWSPKYNLKQIIESAWNWEQNRKY